MVPDQAIVAFDKVSDDRMAVLTDDGVLTVLMPKPKDEEEGKSIRLTVRPDGTGTIAITTHFSEMQAMMTGVDQEVDSRELETAAMVADSVPMAVMFDSLAQQVRVVWADGTVRRISVFRNTKKSADGRSTTVLWDYGEFIEQVDTLVDAEGNRRLNAAGQPAVITNASAMLGRRTTLMVDDSGGMVGWIDAKGKNVLDYRGRAGSTIDQIAMRAAHDLSSAEQVTAMTTGSALALVDSGLWRRPSGNLQCDLRAQGC